MRTCRLTRKNEEYSKLLYPTYDARLTDLKIAPKCYQTKVSYKLTMYDSELEENVKRKMLFEDVVAIEFHMNYFDNMIGAEVCGFYEIFDKDEKLTMLEHNFNMRRVGFLCHGDYEYDAEEANDILNYRESIEEVKNDIDSYRLFQQQTTGGIYVILAKTWKVE